MKCEFNKIAVIGLGYIGLPTAAVFASRKREVLGVDVNESAVNTINKGEIHIIEPQLDIVVRAAVSEGYLRASLSPEPADAYIIAVPTPFLEDHRPDLSYIISASKAIAPHLKSGNLVVLESTSPVGATNEMCKILSECRPDLTFPDQHGNESDIRVAHCPERVLPGHVLRELVQNDRVIGGISPKCTDAAIDLYKIFVSGECISTDAKTAEMCKLTENACRDVQIAFANELSMICDKHNLDVWELINLANRHPRINILQPGPGVGGHCIAVDPWFIVSQNPSLAKLIKTAREVNDHKPMWVLEQIKKAIDELLLKFPQKHPDQLTIACYGLSFKPNIDDLRESPALNIVKSIRSFHCGELLVVEPNISCLPNNLTNLKLVSLESAKKLSDIHILLVDHNEFISTKPPAGALIDTKGIWGTN
jgi:UDP-N-acetyl-D-mannosaminuronic acid dehydrogenase